MGAGLKEISFVFIFIFKIYGATQIIPTSNVTLGS
tara:strand:+ start:552 stop:656 length:105 start_codon:yes stop_codon:yes gene_type:complete